MSKLKAKVLKLSTETQFLLDNLNIHRDDFISLFVLSNNDYVKFVDGEYVLTESGNVLIDLIKPPNELPKE